MEFTKGDFDDLRAGDRVIVMDNQRKTVYSIREVTRITSKFIMTGEIRYNRETGRETGNRDRWDLSYFIYPTTDENMTKYKQWREKQELLLRYQRISAYFRETAYSNSKLTPDELATIEGIIKAAQERN